MEVKNNVKKGWRAPEEKEQMVLQWQQSGKSRKRFCEETGIGYNSLVSWCKQMKDKKDVSGFTEVTIKPDCGLFAQVHFPGGKRIDFFHSVPVEYFHSLIK